MRLERSRNVKRNGIWGLLTNVVIVILPFVVRTVMIKEMGAEYLGLNSLFSSILTVLNITELGFGSAIIYHMYKPLADNNIELLSALLNFYKKVYRTIGLIIFCVGICIVPFLKFLIKGNVPEDTNLYVLYIMYLLNTVISYWLFAYKGSILAVHQRNDIKSKIALILSIIMYCGQISVIILTQNYYLYLSILVIYTTMNNIIPAIYIKKNYPEFICKGKINKSLKKDIKLKVSGLMITKISIVSRNAFDSIIVSSFLGLTAVAIYNNYYYIITALTSLMAVITTSIAAGVGNSVAMDSPNKNLKDMNIMNFWYMWIASWCMVCLVCLYQPFMRLWVGEQLMLPEYTMMLFAFYFLMQKVGDIQAQYFDATGLWWERRWYSICEALANLVLNIVLGYIWGMTGIVIATILTVFFINFLGATRILFMNYFHEGLKEYIFKQLFYIMNSIWIAYATYCICKMADRLFYNEKSLILEIIFRGIICIFVPNVLFWISYRKTNIYKKSFDWIRVHIKF